MPGGKYGGKQVFEDDFDYDDYLEDDYEEEDDYGYDAPAVKLPTASGKKPAPSSSTMAAPQQEYDDFISELLGGDTPQVQPPQESPQQQPIREQSRAGDGHSKLAHYLTGNPPPRPSGRLQNTGREQEAARLAQQISLNGPAHVAAADIQRFKFDEPSPDESVLRSQRAAGGNQMDSWLREPVNQSSQATTSSAAALNHLATPQTGPADAMHSNTTLHWPKIMPYSPLLPPAIQPAPLDENGWQVPPPEVLQPVQNTSHMVDITRGEAAARHELSDASRDIELDDDGWQKLPLYMEMDMLQQAAHGEDGISPLQATQEPRERWWKQDRARRPDIENGEPSLRDLRKKSPLRERRPSSAEYVMDADLKKRCKLAEAEESKDLNGKTKLHLVVLGHVDAGKSTLMGRLLHELGVVSQRVVRKNEKDAASMGKASFSWAWLLDERPQERARGVTIDVASAYFETDHHAVTLLDAPGHRDFVPNMIAGAAQADAALLLVDGSTGNFEAGFEPSAGFGSMGGGQTREHAQLARSLGVDQMAVVISKLDTCNYSQARFEEIKAQLVPFLKQCGFRESALHWLPAVGILNQNLVNPPDAPELKAWWTGPTLVQAIDSFNPASRNVDTPLRLPINDIFKGDRGGQSVGGKIEAGAIKVGTAVKVMPSGESGSIKSIVIKKQTVSLARAGDSADVTLTGLDAAVLISGAVICHPDFPVPMVTRFQARVVVLDVNAPVLRGQQVTIHAHAAMENGHISQLIATVDPKTGESSKKKPRVLTKNQSAVIEVTVLRAMCLEQYSDCRALGRVILREGGQTLAVGVVTTILD